MDNLYKVTSTSKDNHQHEWEVHATSKEEATAVTNHLLDVVKGWSQYQYKVTKIKKVK